MVNDSVTQGNVFYRNGIGSSVATRWNLIDNLFFEGGIFWNNLDINPMRDGYMLLRRNAFINPPQRATSPASPPAGASTPGRKCSATASLTATASGWRRTLTLSTTAGARKYKTLDEVRKEFKWELNGDVRPYDKGKDTVESVAKAMGGNVVTFRIPWGKHSGEARPMLASVRGNCRWPGAVLSTDTSVMPCYFWRVADGNYDADPLLDGYARFAHYYYWLATSGAERENENHGCLWYCDAEGKFPADLETKTPCRKGRLHEWGQKMMYTEGDFWLVMEGLHPEKMLPQGVGYWSPCLAAAPGGEDHRLAEDTRQGPGLYRQGFSGRVAALHQRDRTAAAAGIPRRQGRRGQDAPSGIDRRRLRLDGGQGDGIRPGGAVRMALFFGLLPCKGKVNFDDIHITTASESR